MEIGPGAFEIEAGGAASVATEAILERVEGGKAVRLEGLDVGKGYRLVEDCGATTSCVSLTAGAPLRPVPFRGFDCSAQCNASCRANVFLGRGPYRLSITGCSGTDRLASLPFELPDGPPEGLERGWAGTAIVSAIAARVDLPTGKPAWTPADPRAPGTIAGLRARGAERPLDAQAVAELGAFLRAKDGYDDQIRKRCAMSGLVAFRITRDLVTSGAPRRAEVEVAIDLHCAKIFVVREPSPNGKRVVHGSHFDPSRPAMAALVRRLFPEAADLR